MIELKSIEKNEAMRYMGQRGKADKNLTELVDLCEHELIKVINPKYIYSCYDIIRKGNNISLEGCALPLEGDDIKNHLEGCEKAVLMCATLSIGADTAIRQAEISDMAKAFAMDALASAAIEQFCCKTDQEILSEFPKYYGTWRFSPGYGDFPIAVQKSFVSALNAQKRIGLCVSESGILTPRKSVTAVMGLSKEPVSKKRRGCASCNMNKTCQYRIRGEHCGF